MKQLALTEYSYHVSLRRMIFQPQSTIQNYRSMSCAYQVSPIWMSCSGWVSNGSAWGRSCITGFMKWRVSCRRRCWRPGVSRHWRGKFPRDQRDAQKNEGSDHMPGGHAVNRVGHGCAAEVKDDPGISPFLHKPE